MFRNLKVSIRLALGFGAVSLLLAAVVLMGIHSVASVSDNVGEMANDTGLSFTMQCACARLGSALVAVIVAVLELLKESGAV